MNSNYASKGGASSLKSTRTERDGDASSDDLSSLPGTATYSIGKDGSLTQEQKSQRRRRPFTPERRSEVAGVRKVGACAYCRKKKISCKHALDKTIQAVSPSTSTTSPRPDNNFESDHPDLYLSDNYSRDLLPPDVYRGKSLPSGMDSTESTVRMFRTIPTPAAHLDRIALDMHDFDTVFEDVPATTHLDMSYPEPDWTLIPYEDPNEPEAVPSEPSSRSDNTHLSSLSPPSSNASDSGSTVTYRNATRVFHCDIPGCDLTHGFAFDIDLRRHQEARHPDLFPRSVTFACPVEGCRHQHRPFVRSDTLMEHLRLNHTELLQRSKGLHEMESDELDPLRLGKKHQVEKYLAGEYMTGMNNNLVAFPARNSLPGENPPFLLSTGRVTTSSRGRGAVRKPRSTRNTAATNTSFQGTRSGTIPIAPPWSAPPSWNLDSDLGNTMASSPLNDMNSLYAMAPSPFDQGSILSQGFGAVPNQPASLATDRNFSIPFESPPQPSDQFYGSTPTSMNFQSMYANAYDMRGTMPTQQGFGNPDSFQNGYHVRPFANTDLQQAPAIRVRQPTFHEAAPSNSYDSTFVHSPVDDPLLLGPFNSPLNTYLDQQNLIFHSSSSRDQQPQYSGMQSSTRDIWGRGFVDERSISDNYDIVSPQDSSSITFSSSPTSEIPENRRASLGSLNRVLHDGFSGPATPGMDIGGPRSSSSDASPCTVVEAPTTRPVDSRLGDFSSDKFSCESFGELLTESQDFYGLDEL